jgi:hypothetical protein
MRTLILGAALLAAAAPLAAQAHQHDPDHAAAPGAGTVPAGWHARADRAGADVAGLRMAAMAPGWHVTTGPAVILWRPEDAVAGEFTASATLHQTKAPTHPEAYGIFVGGSGLDTAPDYLYFLVRGDGKYMVKHRAASGDVHTVVDWTESPAVHRQNEAGAASNALTVEGGPWGVRFKVNGTQVGEFAGVKSSGIVGLRVNHNLDVHASELTVTRR